MSFLYPLYDGKGNGGATVINQGPLMRVSFGNIIRNSKTGRGLLGYMNGFTFDPALEFGMFNRRGVLRSDPNLKGRNPQWNEYYPKTFRLNFEMVVLHEHELGYEKKGRGFYDYNSKHLNEGNFPYLTERKDTGEERTIQERVKNKDPQGVYRNDPNSPFYAKNSSGILGPKNRK